MNKIILSLGVLLLVSVFLVELIEFFNMGWILGIAFGMIIIGFIDNGNTQKEVEEK